MDDNANGKRGRGRPRLSDEAIALTREALRASGGNIARAAVSLGMSAVGALHRTRRDPAAWPDGVAHRSRGRPAREGEASEAVVTATQAALREARGNVTRAAPLLGLTKQGLHQRLNDYPTMWPADLPARRRHSKKTTR